MSSIKPLTWENQNGQMKIGGIAVDQLVKDYGSPLYIMDVATIRTQINSYFELQKLWSNSKIAYASKALSITALYQLMSKSDLFFDVVSAGEFFTVLNAGVDASRVYFHGNNKTVEEIEFALDQGLGTFVIDNSAELDRIASVMAARKMTHSVRCLMRIAPEIEAHTHEFVQTGQRDTKFGVHLEKLDAFVEKISSMPQFNFAGLHAHIGSQIFDVKPFTVLVDRLVEWTAKLQTKHNISLDEVSIGGGIGIKYLETDDPPSIRSFVQQIGEQMKKSVQANGLDERLGLVLEPGRSLVATAGVSAYTVGSVKSIENGKTYIAVDGGMADNPRPITYDAEYSAEIVNKLDIAVKAPVTVVGKFCESGDVLIKRVELPAVEPGDRLVIYGTGAYSYAMSSNYNRFLKPAMIFVENGKSELVLKRETYEDLIRNDLKVKS